MKYIRLGKLPEKYYEACITYNIINYFKERRAEKVFPFAVSQVREKDEGYDFGYNLYDKIFLIQYKRPQKTSKGYSWTIDMEQLKILTDSVYSNVVYYAFPQFEDYKLWYKALDRENVKFIDVLTLRKYLLKAGKKTINSENVELKDWEQVVFELFRDKKYLSALPVNLNRHEQDLLHVLQLEGVIGYEIE